MLPDDYPSDFSRPDLLDEWFRDVPWRIQAAAMNVNPAIRVIQNPATQVFVLVMKLRPEDPSCRAPYPFFGSAVLLGWFPMIETGRGQPVEAVYRICEGMQASAAVFDANYGETPGAISAQLKLDKDRAETKRLNDMLESTALARRFAQGLRAKELAMTVSNAKGARIYEGAGKEFGQELDRRARKASEPFLVTR